MSPHAARIRRKPPTTLLGQISVCVICVVALGSLLSFALSMSALAMPMTAMPMASISLVLTPDRTVALLPGESKSIEWQIIPTNGIAPEQVDFSITNHDGEVLLEESYTGTDGLRCDACLLSAPHIHRSHWASF